MLTIMSVWANASPPSVILYGDRPYAGGLLRASPARHVPPRPIQEGRALASCIVDRVRVKVIKDGKNKGTRVPAADLGTMLTSEAFLQQFPPVDEVTRVPLYLPPISCSLNPATTTVAWEIESSTLVTRRALSGPTRRLRNSSM